MTIQMTAALISFAGITLVAGIFLFVAQRSRHDEPYAVIQPRAYRLRSRLFVLLLLVGLPVAAATLSDLPYSRAEAVRDPVPVDVTAHQWYWELSRQSVEAHRPVLFRVGSVDVNHGFAIYDGDRRLIAQVQAMPGYTNELVVEFDRPGTYQILCLEYCGLVHHAMMASIEVLAPIAGSERF